MNWVKKGLIFCPAGDRPDWMATHAANPVAEPLGGGQFRVYFSPRDRHNRSSIGSFDFNIEDPTTVCGVSSQPLVGPGPLGLFDDSGVSAGCLVIHEGKKYLYYVGWNLGVTVPWRNSIGLAIGSEDGAFVKPFRAPIVDRSEIDPFSLSYPWVMKDDDGWRMWYGSNLQWGANPQEMHHVIKYAESSDGIRWERTGLIAIGLSGRDEYGVSRPCVIKDGDRFKMWYSSRRASYRIGYAESRDGIQWVRRDEEVGMEVSLSGWDSAMIEYPCVFDYRGQRYMLYNGDGYGKTGIGLARLDQN